MGITVHIEGKLNSEDDYNNLILDIINFAERNDLKFHLLKDKEPFLKNHKKNSSKQVVTKGIIVEINKKCEHLLLEFDEDLELYSFCKTQFTEIESHILIISLLRKIEKYFVELKIFDEGKFWETNDEFILKEEFEKNLKLINEAEEFLKSKKDNRWKYN